MPTTVAKPFAMVTMGADTPLRELALVWPRLMEDAEENFGPEPKIVRVELDGDEVTLHFESRLIKT